LSMAGLGNGELKNRATLFFGLCWNRARRNNSIARIEINKITWTFSVCRGSKKIMKSEFKGD